MAPLGVQMKHNTERLHKRAGTDLYIETGLFMDHVSYRTYYEYFHQAGYGNPDQ